MIKLLYKINLKENVDALMKVKETELTKNFDKAVGEKIELKRAITKIWMDIQKPIRVNKKEVLVYSKGIVSSPSVIWVILWVLEIILFLKFIK